MSNLNQFLGAGSQIGDAQFIPDTGVLVNKPSSGEVWLRSGTLALSSLYPAAIAPIVEHIMCHGAAQIVMPAAPTQASPFSWAANGAGTIVLCFGNVTNVMVSTNHGASWSLIAHNLGVPATTVCWNGTQFIVAGNSATTITCAYSIAAAVFTLGGTAAVTTATANTAAIVWDSVGSLALITVSGTSAAQAATTPSGVTLTARTLSQNLTSPAPMVLGALGVSRWYITSSTTAAVQSTAADGSAWANRTAPAASSSSIGALNNLVMANSIIIYKSTSGTDGTWTSVSNPFNSTITFAFDGTRLILNTLISTSAQFSYTTDLVNFTARQCAFLPAGGYVIPSGANLAIVGSSGTVGSYAANWATTSEYLGIYQATYLSGTGKNIYTYSRVK